MAIWKLFLFILIVVVALVFLPRSGIAASFPMMAAVVGGSESKERRRPKEPRAPKLRPSLRKKDLVKHPRSKAEAACIGILKSLTGLDFPTVYTDWLFWKGHALELDGYNDEAKLALEFSGPQHTKWNPRAESYETYYERIVRDLVKVKMCKKNGVNLIVVDMSLPRVHWRDYLASRLYDIGMGTRPVNYIDAQVAEVYRNEQIEKELGLNDYAMAERI